VPLEELAAAAIFRVKRLTVKLDRPIMVEGFNPSLSRLRPANGG